MRVLLVRPARTPQSVTLGEMMFSEPLGLEMVAAALRGEHEVEVLDLMAVEALSSSGKKVYASWGTSGMKGDAAWVKALEGRLAAFRPDVVGLTSLCVDVPAVRRLAAMVKVLLAEVFVVVGGTQAFLAPEAFDVPEVDAVLQRSTRDGVIEHFREIEGCIGLPRSGTKFWSGTGTRQNFGTDPNHDPSRPKFPDLQANEYWLPDRRCTAAWRGQYAYFGFRPCAIMQTSQGCSAHCDFCLRWRMEGPCERDFPMDIVMADLKAIEEPSVMIFDNDFLNNGPRLLEFCERLDQEQEDISRNFICYASVHSILKNPEAIIKFRDRGLKAVLVGYETFSDTELAAYKKPSRAMDALRAAKWLKSAGIDVWASFMLHPDWTARDFKTLRRHIKGLAPEIATFSPLTPFPGLPMYRQYKDAGRLLFDQADYSAWSFGQVMIRPSAMSLRAYYFEVLKTILYLNFVSNHLTYITRKFGAGTLLRLSRGAAKVFFRYIRLMLEAGKEKPDQVGQK